MGVGEVEAGSRDVVELLALARDRTGQVDYLGTAGLDRLTGEWVLASGTPPWQRR